MEIQGNIKLNGWLRVVDLEYGDVFIFEDDDSTVYLKTSDNGYVDLLNGEMHDEYDREDACVRVLDKTTYNIGH